MGLGRAGKSIMRNVYLAALFIGLLGPAAQAVTPVEIQVLSSGVTASGLRVFSVAFPKATHTIWENGPDVEIVGGTVGIVDQNARSSEPGDVVVLPVADMDALEQAGALASGTKTPLGRVDFGVDVKAGTPHPDIATREKFIAVMKAANAVAFNDPATQSLGGITIDKFLSLPEYAGVRKLPGGGARDVASGKADIGIQTMSELLSAQGVEFAGLVPAYLNAHIHFSIAVLTKAAHPKEARDFIRYVTRPQAAAIWKENGVIR
jgi:molybdate transport system substrate-binding protein